MSVDGKATRTTEDLGAVLAELKPGDKVTVVVRRGGEEQEVEVTLGEL